MADQDNTGAGRLPGPRQSPKRLAWKVKVEIHLVVRAPDQNKAENLVLDLMEKHLGDMLDCPQVMATSGRLRRIINMPISGDQGPRLTPAQVAKYRDRMRPAGDPAIKIGRFIYQGRALNIQTGELQIPGINVMYQWCYWYWDQETLLEILADLREQLPEKEKGRLRLYAGD